MLINFKVLIGLKEVNETMRSFGMFAPGEGVGSETTMSMKLTKSKGTPPLPRAKSIRLLGYLLKREWNKNPLKGLEILRVEHIGPGKPIGVINENDAELLEAVAKADAMEQLKITPKG